MNSFSVLQGFTSDNVQDYVHKQKQVNAAAKQQKSKPAAKKGNAGRSQSKQAKRVQALAKQKDFREGAEKKGGKPFDRNRLQPRRGRAFDRYNPPGKGSKRIKKGGAGAHNWGRPGEGTGLNEAGATGQKDVTIEKTDELVEKAAEETTTEQTPATEGETTTTEEAPKEEEDNTMTYEEFMKQKSQETKRKPQAKDVDMNRVKQSIQKENLKTLQKPEEKVIALGNKSNKNKTRKHKKLENTLDLAELIPDQPQKRSFGRGGRGGRGRGRGGRGGRGNRGGKRRPNTESQAEFPSL